SVISARQRPPETKTTGISASEPAANTLDSRAQDFPAATDDQYNRSRKQFINSLDSSAVCSLASLYNNGKACEVVRKTSGSFNVCFFVTFSHDSPEWIVRVPIEPAFEDPWDKLQSEVATIQYLECNTQIPVPHIHAYGRQASLTDHAGTQMFIISDFIPGHALDKKLLTEAKPAHRTQFYSHLIDILAELRALEFPSIGSLLPDSTSVSCPNLGPVISMLSVMLRQPPRRTVSSASVRQPPCGPFSSAKEYLSYQFRTLSEFFLLPVPDHTVEDIKEEIFALHHMERLFHQVIDPPFDEGPFVLQHLDLRAANIVVDENLAIRGIIDWEFASTIPRQLFTPPSWITGHDPAEANNQAHVDFRNILDEKSKASDRCDRLRTEWYGERDSNANPTSNAFCIAHVLRRPTDLVDVFHAFWTQRDAGKHIDDLISDYFNENQALSAEAQRRAEQCEHYTNSLKMKGLYETDIDRLLAESRALTAKLDGQKG
ncbi:hypothetical protein BN1723_011735, partial [Verticillium longisporum]